VFIEDIRTATEFEYSDLLRRHGVVALVNVPIGAAGSIWGVLEADGDRPRRFSIDDRNFLLGFANLVSAAVERRRHDQDVTEAGKERERLLVELRAARDAAEAASASKTQLLATAAHDFRQPLQSAMLTLELLEQRMTAPPDNIALLRRAMRAVTESSGLLERWLEFSRIESGQIVPERRPFPVAVLLDELAESFAPMAIAAGLALRFARCDVVVLSDPELLREILRNIVGNALKYTSAGSVDIHWARNDQTLAISVRDTGVGMPTDKVETAFQPFHRLDPSRGTGVGLGLSIVKRLTDLLGHRISVHSRPGEGTCVTVEVPIAE
jgi:signal transduction histidine kinase